jgi:citrate synthase
MANPETNSVIYRGYPVQELCRRCSFEEVSYILWHSELPTRSQLAAQNRIERAQRALTQSSPPPSSACRTPPTRWTRYAPRSACSAHPIRPPATTPRRRPRQGSAAVSRIAAVVAMDQWRRRVLGGIPPRDDLSYAANFLYMTFGKVPEPQIVAAFQTSLIL